MSFSFLLDEIHLLLFVGLCKRLDMSAAGTVRVVTNSLRDRMRQKGILSLVRVHLHNGDVVVCFSLSHTRTHRLFALFAFVVSRCRLMRLRGGCDSSRARAARKASDSASNRAAATACRIRSILPTSRTSLRTSSNKKVRVRDWRTEFHLAHVKRTKPCAQTLRFSSHRRRR